MPAKRKKTVPAAPPVETREERERKKEERRRQLVGASNENPNGFFSYEETGIICGFGQDSMTALAGIGAPVAFRKMNPALLRAWIAQNQSLIRKLEDAN